MTERSEDMAHRVNAVTRLASIVLKKFRPSLPEFTTFVAMFNGAMIEAAARNFDTDRGELADVVAEATKDTMGILVKDRKIN